MIIPNFPPDLLNNHMKWHMDHSPGHGGTLPGQPGYGQEFLDFHRDFIRDVIGRLTNDRHIDPSLLAPWTEIPPQVKTSPSWTPGLAGVESRIVSRPYSLYTSDALGNFLDTPPDPPPARLGLHGWIHEVGPFSMTGISTTEAITFSNFDTAPTSTLFYNWHGLIENWRMRVEAEFPWPRRIDWPMVLSGSTLADGDVINATIEKNVLPPPPPGVEAAVEFVLTSNLPWTKKINVPDGETGSSWDIWTGYQLYRGQRSRDSVALWAHQVQNGQLLTFTKAKTLGYHSNTYRLGGLEILEPGDRVTFDWVSD